MSLSWHSVGAGNALQKSVSVALNCQKQCTDGPVKMHRQSLKHPEHCQYLNDAPADESRFSAHTCMQGSLEWRELQCGPLRVEH